MQTPGRWRTRRLRVPVPFLLALIAYLWWLAIVPPVATGDEAHYVAVADSIALDGDLDVTDQYDAGSPITDRGQLEPAGQAFDPNGSGVLRSIRQPGLPTLLAPVRLVTDELTALRWVMVLIAAALAHHTYRLAGDLRLDERPWLLRVAWAGTFLTLPALGYSNQLYPEVPGAFACVLAGRLLVRSRRRPWAAVAAVAVLSALPFLIIRFLPLAVGLTAIAVATTPNRPTPTQGSSPSRLPAWVSLRPLIVAPLAGAVAILGMLFVHLYGSPLPTAAYPAGTTTPPSLLGSYQFGLGTLLGASSGLVPHSPFLWLGAVGSVTLARRFGTVGWAILGLTLTQALVVSPQGFFGFSLPGRFLIVALPLFALAAAAALHASGVLVVAGIVLLACSAALVPHAGQRYPLLLDRGYPQLPALSRVSMLFPEFHEQPGLSEFAVGLPNTGHLVPASSPSFEIAPGPYEVTVTAERALDASATPVTVSIIDERRGTIVARAERAAPAPDAPAALPPKLYFQVTELTELHVEISDEGGGSGVTVFGARIGPAPDLAAPIREDLPFGLLWVAATGFAAVMIRPEQK